MLDKILDRLSVRYLTRTSAAENLNRLERDVWRLINASHAEMFMPWYDKMMMAFAVPQFRVASLVIALIIGVGASSVILDKSVGQPSYDIAEMQIFTMQAPYLPSNLIGNMK